MASASLCLPQKAGMGKRPLEAWQAVIDTLGLEATAEQLYAESEPLLTDRRARRFVDALDALVFALDQASLI